MHKLRNIKQKYQQIPTHTTNQIIIIIQKHYPQHHIYQTSNLTIHYR